jgi:hypothetical protein
LTACQQLLGGSEEPWVLDLLAVRQNGEARQAEIEPHGLAGVDDLRGSRPNVTDERNFPAGRRVNSLDVGLFDDRTLGEGAIEIESNVAHVGDEDTIRLQARIREIEAVVAVTGSESRESRLLSGLHASEESLIRTV